MLPPVVSGVVLVLLAASLAVLVAAAEAAMNAEAVRGQP